MDRRIHALDLGNGSRWVNPSAGCLACVSGREVHSGQGRGFFEKMRRSCLSHRPHNSLRERSSPHSFFIPNQRQRVLRTLEEL
jgi:hypothetical protein